MKSLFALFSLALLAGCSSPSDAQPPVRTVPHVDLNRYSGDWYVIASIPYSAEKEKVAARQHYEFRSDGGIRQTSFFREKSLNGPAKEWRAKGKILNHETNAEWNLQYCWPVKLPYRVIDLDPDYRWAVMGHPSRNFIWVLSREPFLDERIQHGILQRAAAQGYDTSKISPVPQSR